MKIGFLGVGHMGAPMIKLLLAAGHELTVWNRTRERADALAGVRVANTPAEAAGNSEVVMTSLFDDASHEEALFGANGLLGAMRPCTLHISLSTISVAFSERLTREHQQRGLAFVAAPVFGRPNIAQEGKLWIVMAGQDEAVAKARPLLEPLSRRISIVGKEPKQAHALKLGGNFLISAMIHSLSEAFVYAESLGIEPEVFLDTVNSALFQSPFYAAYGKVMVHPPEKPGATVALGAKDVDLMRKAAAGAGVQSSLADTLAEIFEQAKQDGLGAEDWAVGQYRMAQKRGKLEHH